MKKPTNPSASSRPPIRICHERIVPDELDPEVHVRRALRSLRGGDGEITLDPEAVAHNTRMALVNSKKWARGSTLRCRFLDGSKKMKKAVEAAAHEWEQHANVTFKFVTSGEAQVRISFYADDGSWSAVGRDALNRSYFPLHQPTMNFGWVRDDSTVTEIKSVVLHEFGHALGCIHEHQSPTFKRKWDPAKVIEYFQGPPNYWDEETIRNNVLGKYSPNGVSATRYDPESIMLYWFDAELFSDGKGATNENNILSSMDKEMIARLYP